MCSFSPVTANCQRGTASRKTDGLCLLRLFIFFFLPSPERGKLAAEQTASERIITIRKKKTLLFLFWSVDRFRRVFRISSAVLLWAGSPCCRMTREKKSSFLVVWLPIPKIARMLLLWDNRKTFPTYLSNTKNTRACRTPPDVYTHFSLQLYKLPLHVRRRVKVQLGFCPGVYIYIYVCRWMDMANTCMCVCAGCYISFLFERLPEGMFSFSLYRAAPAAVNANRCLYM